MVSSVVSDRQNRQTPTWQWQSCNGSSYLTCSLLQAWQHGFFTRQFYPRSPDILTEALQPQAKSYRVKQVHGNRVLTPSEIEANLNAGETEDAFSAADGLITEDSGQAIWVASADCSPVLIGDIYSRRVAAVHAGWRGTALRIVPEAIARFLDFGSALENLRVAMGPAIAGEVYQVTEYVAAEVGESLVKKKYFDTSEAILASIQAMPDSPLIPDSQPGRVRLDVRRVNTLQLEQLGIDKAQIAIAPYCTYQQSEHFFSFRRTKEKKVQWSGIVSH